MTLRAVLLFCFGLLWATFSAAAQPPLDYLKAMTHAHKTLNYEQLYLFTQGDETETFRHRHAVADSKRYAQQLRLDFMREEIILRDETVSYFGGFQPLSLPSPQIMDNVPTLLFADFERLARDYHFIDFGKNRVADRVARVIRITPKDEFRYQYVVWIDEENFLLLRADLTDKNNQLLEQFRVLQSVVSEDVQGIIAPIQALTLPHSGITTAERESEVSWQLPWLPSGFEAVRGKTHRFPDTFLNEETPESRFYSDGLFSFSVYVLENKGIIFNEQFWQEGKLSIYGQTVGEKDIIIIGDIPPATIRHILQEMHLNAPLAEGNSQ